MVWIVLAAWPVLLWSILTEFSYFAAPLHRALYAWSAWYYESKWRGRAYSEGLLDKLSISRIRQNLEGRDDTVVVDLACGTGRVARALLAEAWFRGSVISIDASPQMLAILRDQASTWPDPARQRLTIEEMTLDGRQGPLPPADIVTFLEAGEFLPNFQAVLAQACSALKPGGLLVLTKPPDHLGWLFFGRAQTWRSLSRLLNELGLVDAQRFTWRWRYEIVMARKPGEGASSTPGNVVQIP